MSEIYKHISLSSQATKRHLIALAIECGWKKWVSDDDDPFLFVSSTGSVGTAQKGSVIHGQGEAITLEQFVTLIQNPPEPQRTVISLALKGCTAQVSSDGWLHVHFNNCHTARWSFTPEETSRIFLAHTTLNSTIVSDGGCCKQKENGNHSHE